MKRDAERYALVEFINDPIKIMFSLINMKVEKHRKVYVKNKEISCNCFDFKIRCKKNKLICKHIIYVLRRILNLEMEIIKNLKIKDYTRFTTSFDRIKINNKPNEVKSNLDPNRKLTAEDLCAVCFCDFLEELENTIVCKKCNGLVHKDCMLCWIKNSVCPGCAYCKDQTIVKFLTPYGK